MLKHLILCATLLGQVQFTQPTPTPTHTLSVREQFDAFCKEKKLNNDEVKYFEYIIKKESGFNHTVTNPTSGAYGLGQALPASKMASAGSDWRTNPTTQLKWMYKYVMDRYGSFANAYQHHIKKGWY